MIIRGGIIRHNLTKFPSYLTTFQFKIISTLYVSTLSILTILPQFYNVHHSQQPTTGILHSRRDETAPARAAIANRIPRTPVPALVGPGVGCADAAVGSGHERSAGERV